MNKKQIERLAERIHKKNEQLAKKRGIPSWRLWDRNDWPETKGRGINLATLQREGDAND